jgi:hypothetical protein
MKNKTSRAKAKGTRAAPVADLAPRKTEKVKGGKGIGVGELQECTISKSLDS